MPYSDPEKRRSYHAEFIRKRKEKWFAENGPCALCGSDENLEVDHIDPAVKSFSVHWGMRADLLAIELSKCRALCEKCHTQLSGDQKRKPENEVKKPKCKCEECRLARNAYAREYVKRPHVVARILAKQREARPSLANGYFMNAGPKVAIETHGTKIGYYLRGCRCEVCCAWAARWNEARRKPRKPKPDPLPIPHGEQRGYQRGCRCDPCREAYRVYQHEKRELQKAKLPPKPEKAPAVIVHGRVSSYCYHACRCELCREAAMEYQRGKVRRKREAAAAP